MKAGYENLNINQKQNDLHIKVLPTTKFKTTTITLKFMAPLDSKTMTARSILLIVTSQNYMAHMLIALSQNSKINM